MSRFITCVIVAMSLWRCDTGTLGVSRPQVTISSPTEGAQVLSYQPLTFSASVVDGAAITSFTLTAGTVTLMTCPTPMDNPTCSVQLTPTDVEAQILNGELSLSANATDVHGNKGSRTVVISAKPILVSFTQPVATGTPPVAIVKGTSTLALQAETEAVITDVSVSTSSGLPLHDFGAAAPYQVQIDWPADLQVTSDTLVATATDSEGNTATASLAVVVQCSDDGDCNVGQKCCASSGACYASSMTAGCP